MTRNSVMIVMMSKDYKVFRPPLAHNYDLPTREELLNLKADDFAKVTFQVGSDGPERMWVILKDCSDSELWTGIIDNDATQEKTLEVLPAGVEVEFHPLDIIDTQ